MLGPNALPLAALVVVVVTVAVIIVVLIGRDLLLRTWVYHKIHFTEHKVLWFARVDEAGRWEFREQHENWRAVSANSVTVTHRDLPHARVVMYFSGPGLQYPLQAQIVSGVVGGAGWDVMEHVHFQLCPASEATLITPPLT